MHLIVTDHHVCDSCPSPLNYEPDDEYVGTDIGGELVFRQVRECRRCGQVNESTHDRPYFL